MTVCARCGTENSDQAKFCQECGAPLSPPPATSEERKLVTVLFADVAGSTQLGDRLDAEALAHGDAARAAELLRGATDGYSAAGAEWEAAVSRVELAEALVAQGRPPSCPAC